MSSHKHGFATATVLGLLAVVALLCIATLHDSLFGELLAGNRQLQLRAMTLAELGLQQGMQRVEAMTTPAADRLALQPLPGSQDSVTVELRLAGTGALPAGFSTGRFTVQHFEIESTGHTARGVRARLLQGAERVMPMSDLPPEASP